MVMCIVSTRRLLQPCVRLGRLIMQLLRQYLELSDMGWPPFVWTTGTAWNRHNALRIHETPSFIYDIKPPLYYRLQISLSHTHTHTHTYIYTYTHEDVYKSCSTESITKYTTINTRWEATQRVMAAKLTGLTHKIAVQLHLVAESSTICSSRSRRPVRKLLDTPS
jgi:hypothetical protein